ncbi:MAG: thioredoxin [Candidatus Thorarchaeota archaeon]|nr:MAG: thioredoxin [Candidatus Thorarchaeota archaeon]
MVDDISPEEVEIAVKETRLLLVEAWSPSCGPCKDLGPILEELEEMYEENSNLRIVKINTQAHIGFASKNNIFALPSVLCFFEGEPAKYVCLDSRGDTQVVDRLVGLRPMDHYENMISSLLSI